MLQGFYWESYRHGHTEQFPEIYPGNPNVDEFWYQIVEDKAPEIRDGRFDMIWLPPPCKSGGVGYSPTEFYNPNTMYGDSGMQRNMLEVLWNNGIEPIADIVINHRNGSGSWAGFKNPAWNTKSICRSDEAFSNPNSEVYNIADSLRGAEEEIVPYDDSRQRAFSYESFRDIDHTNNVVREDILKYLMFLKSMGYRGWRYDMVHGYHARHIAEYNRITCPTFSVGEYDWDKHEAQRGWIWNTALDTIAKGNERLKTASSVFDFSTYFSLMSNIGIGCNNNADYTALYGFNNGLGIMGDNTDGLSWKNKAVTFLENHDTGWRTNEDGTNQEHHNFDSFSNNWQVEQGYAYILTHPGVPCVFWKHYFDWGQELQDKIKALINARKVAGVHSGSALHTQYNARNSGVYAAMVEGENGQLYVRIGGDDSLWEPSKSGYENFREYAYGNGWKVWLTLNDTTANAVFQFYPLNNSLTGIPSPINVASIKIPEE
jgi:alpha-amylase